MSLRSFASAVAVVALAASSGAFASNRSVVNLPDGRLFALVGASSQSMSRMGDDFHIVADGIVIDYVDGAMTVDGLPIEVPAFTHTLELKIDGGTVVLTADP